jgi:uncharacterized repeat protein (TIGR03803 family)
VRVVPCSRYAFSFSATAVLLASCAGSQPLIGTPGGMPQASTLAAHATSTKYKTVYSFDGSSDGNVPDASLIDVSGTLYGTTAGGGTYKRCFYYTEYLGCGTVFSVTPGGKEKVLHDFGGADDGTDPSAGFIDVGGTLYGTTTLGGLYDCTYVGSGTTSGYLGCGTVFSIGTDGTEKVLHHFTGYPDGAEPAASLVEVNGKLYGTTRVGGADRSGTVFSITPGHPESLLHNFKGTPDGSQPVAPLIDVSGTLYGTTSGGGAYGGGTVFTFKGGTEKVLHSFGSGSDGGGPTAGLLDVSGTFYGTTSGGGAHGIGTVFSITPGGTEKVLYSFEGGNDGRGPLAGLIAVNGTLYGTTTNGGGSSACKPYGCGTVFSISTSGKEMVLHRFVESDGAYPTAALTDVNGTLYGTASEGGAHSRGSVFALTPPH